MTTDVLVVSGLVLLVVVLAMVVTALSRAVSDECPSST